ncbi:MAG: anaerobic glycerol-3-phosphate dehydrogenase subunit C [Desulfitobacteriaceae bacterium]
MLKERATNLDACIKCSACSARCPVAAVYPLFPGPKSVGPDAERFRLEAVQFDPACLSYCSNCKTCEVTCPSGVHITEMILRARGKKDPNWRHSLRDTILGRAEYLGRLGTIWSGLTNSILKRTAIRWLLEKAVGISRHAPLPAYSRKFSRQGRTQGIHNPKRVVYFPGCFITYNDAATGDMVVKVLEHNDYEVLVPNFHCCGVPLEANGHFAQAKENIRHNLQLMQPYLQEGVPILTSCTSCGLALKEEYPKARVSGSERIGELTYDLFEFLWQMHERGELREEDFRKVTVALGYHAPCHLKAQGIGTPTVRLLRLIPGVQVQDMDAGCCGLSGSFGFKEEKYPLAMEIGGTLFQRVKSGVKAAEFQEITTECGGCQVQIEHGTGIPTRHPVWILGQAYNLVRSDKKFRRL